MLRRTTAHKVRAYFCFARSKAVDLGKRCKLTAPIGLRSAFGGNANARFLLSGMPFGRATLIDVQLAIGHERILDLMPLRRRIA